MQRHNRHRAPLFTSVILFALLIGTWCASAQDDTAEVSTINGGTLYQKLCADCHGVGGIPDPRVAFLSPPPSNLAQRPLRHGETLEEIETVIREGLGQNMISYEERLSTRQIREVARYVQYLRRRGAESPAIGELESVIAPPTVSESTETSARDLPPGS